MSKHAIIFDTHRFVSRLIETGMAQTTAEALADEQIRLIESNLANKNDLAETNQRIEELRAETKHDIENLRSEMHQKLAETNHKIETLRSETHQKLAETKTDLIKWMVGMLIAQAGLIIAFVKLI